jgi:hypothetical protein
MNLQFDAAAHQYTLNGRRIPSVTQILGQVVDFSMVPPDILERKCAIGRALHEAIALDHEDDLDHDSLDAAVLPYFEAWRKFVADAGTRLWIMAAERPLASTVYGYGTTPDIWGAVNGRRAVIELKSTAAIHPSVGLQTAAQEMAITECDAWPGGTDQAVDRYALQLQPSGQYRIHHFKNRGDFAVFIALRSVYGWRASHNLGDFKHGN